MVSEMWGDYRFAIPYHNSTGTPQPPRQMAPIQALLARALRAGVLGGIDDPGPRSDVVCLPFSHFHLCRRRGGGACRLRLRPGVLGHLALHPEPGADRNHDPGIGVPGAELRGLDAAERARLAAHLAADPG